MREVIQDVYSDGSYAVYGNIEKSKVCLVFEEYFNRKEIKKLINKDVPILYILLDLQKLLNIDMNLNKSSFIPINSNSVPTTIILLKSSVFEESQKIINDNCNKSIYELGKEIKKLKIKNKHN